MPRWIDADALIADIKRDNCYDLVAVKKIEQASTVDPFKHGKWIMRGGYFRCSQCDAKSLLADAGETGGFSREYEQVKSSFCPKCGAKMDGA